MTTSKRQSWTIDQLTKSEFFHQKLHEWSLIEIAQQIDQIRGEDLAWDRDELGISEMAWRRVIHRGIKPIIVFAHPNLLTTLVNSTSYYRMLAMVSQKSMIQVGLATIRYEAGQMPDYGIAQKIAYHLNKIVSKLIESDTVLDAREFDMWRGMAAGSQAQGSWQNAKGRKIEIVLQGIIRRTLRERSLAAHITESASHIPLFDGRTIIFADEPDIAIYQAETIVAAVEVKGGIDHAGVLERVGAAIKSLSRAKEINSDAVTILILQSISMTPQSIIDLQAHQQAVNHWFSVEEILQDEAKRDELLTYLGL